MAKASGPTGPVNEGGSSQNTGPKGGSKGPKGPSGGGTGGTINDGGAGQKKGVPLIPTIPDSDGGAQLPEPVDLSLLAGEEKPPARKPLHAQSMGGSFPTQSGITGYAGVFVP